MKIKKITVFGTGKMGARIAFYFAFKKTDVTVYDQDYGLLEEARTKFREFADSYVKDFAASAEDVETALAYIAYSMDISEAAGNADLIVEALPEELAVKKEFYKQLQKTAPENAIFASTSISLDPEELSKASGKADKFLILHFSEEKAALNTSELISLPGTDPNNVETIAQFLKSIDLQVTIKKLKNQN